MIWIIGGTVETRHLIKKIKRKYILTVATLDGGREFKEFKPVVKRMSLSEMICFIKQNKIDLIIDLSHPYAEEVTINAKQAARECNIKYLRYERSRSDLKGCRVFASYDECNSYIQNLNGIFLFTTGSKHIGLFEKNKQDRKYIYRILPSKLSIDECLKNGVDMDRIIAIKGPFSKEFNKAILKEYNIDYIVLKNSGKEGGVEEKIMAAKELNVVPLVIDRHEKESLNLDEIADIANLGADKQLHIFYKNI